jgi:hypothetical protein
MRIAEITMIRIFRDRKHSGKGFLLIIFKTEVELRNRLTIHCSPFALHPLTAHRSLFTVHQPSRKTSADKHFTDY